MRQLASKCLSPQPVPPVQILPKSNWFKIGHLSVCSYISKQEDVKCDLPLGHANGMCFTEMFLKPHQQIDVNLLLANESCQFFRLDRVTTSTQDLSNGGIMIACAASLYPESVHVLRPPVLEANSITITTGSNLKMCVVAVYRRQQLPMIIFLSHFDYYLTAILHPTMPSVILGDFNDNLLSTTTNSFRLLGFMAAKGFSQQVTMPTTDSGSLLDHIYYNGSTTNSFVDVVDTYYSDHDASYLSVPL